MLSDLVLLFVERVSRQLYWSWPELRRWRWSIGKRLNSDRKKCRRDELLRYLDQIGVKDGALVMVHTGTDNVEIMDESCRGPYNAIVQAQTLMQDLLRLTAPRGTLVMPTQAKYQTDELRLETTTSEITTYDPRRSPCGVGLVNELFWRREGVKRSLFPFNMLAACGLLADELLCDNLNKRHPSPHGTDSGYYRFCQHNGLVVSIGVPLREYITIAHVVEEVREDWPIKDFFTERNFRVVEDGIAKEWTVRLRRDDYAKFAYCRSKMGRDMVAEGVIHEGRVGTVRVDWARAGVVFDFMWRKTKNSSYPYYAIWMMRKPWR